MKTSVIIPTYKRTALLPAALASVVAQDFPKQEYEILVVDNAPESTPAIKALCDPCAKPSIRYIHEPNNGAHNARHAGARIAKGEILVYIDDDEVCPPGWLSAMLAPYQDEMVAMAGGKVILHYETAPPEWLYQFNSLLGACDWGDIPCVRVPYDCLMGGNMSVRTSVFFTVGGFNLDAFGDPRLIHLSGDGECGLARKVYDAELKVWYAPEAWLEHRVPAKRMTLEYIQQRSAIEGVRDAYADLRYHRRTVVGLLVRSGHSMLYFTYHRFRAYLYCHKDDRRLSHLVTASRYWSRSVQQWRQALSETLREQTVQTSYL